MTARPLRITFLCKRFFTNKDLFDERYGRYFHLPVELAKQGCSVTVWALDNRRGIQEVLEHEGARLESIPITISSGPRCLKELAQRASEEADLIIAGGHLFLGLIGKWVADRAQVPWVFDATDYYPAHLPAWAFGKVGLFRWLLKEADGVVAMSDPLSEWIGPAQPRRITLTTGVEDRFRHAPSREAACEQLGWSVGPKRIGYFGSIMDRTGVDDLLAAHRMVVEKIPEAELVLAGKVSLKTPLDGPGVNYVGFLTMDEVVVAMAACDVLVIPYWDHPHNRYAGPCKIAEYLAVGRPVVVTNVGNYATFFEGAPQSLCEPASPESMGQALVRQLAEPTVQPFPEALTWSSMAAELHAFCGAIHEGRAN
ncbi:glycosyltransferase [Cerasicoccus maritimus]|uniref:glycosyltransferase n=1 Tax=Cerasicoccus maritimus TaxID=490089 RepID=UPI002852C989|nr:glycosyltransferase [Cerasicoccus maritimus]